MFLTKYQPYCHSHAVKLIKKDINGYLTLIVYKHWDKFAESVPL